MKTTGSNMMGFGKPGPDDEPVQPNRAARREGAKRAKRAKRRGQRAFERALRNGDGMRKATLEGDLAATEALQ